jgi:phosphate transport system permease protein
MKSEWETSKSHLAFRQIKSRIALMILTTMSWIAILPLFFILGYLLKKGLGSLTWDLFTQLPKPVGEIGGGVLHAMMGTLWMVGAASIISIPTGILLAILLSQYPHRRVSRLLRMVLNILASLPSIVIGVFAYTLIVITMKKFSGFAGSCALILVMVPMIARSAEELLIRVPTHLKEAGLALGLPQWVVILKILIPSTLSSLITVSLVAVARASGETAPLLFTALGSQSIPKSMLQPMASLPVQIYQFAVSPYDEWQQLAWGCALLLVILVMITNLVSRLVMARTFKQMGSPLKK